jgi:hypothetical protein
MRPTTGMCLTMSSKPDRSNKSENGDDTIVPINTVRPIPNLIRVVAGIGGVAFAVAGCIATFRTSNQAGSVAVLALGAVLIVVAILGQQISRFRAGEYEVVFALLAQASRERASGDEERAGVLVDTALAQVTAQQGSTVLATKTARVVAERRILDAIVRSSKARILGSHISRNSRAGEVTLDGLLETDNLRIGIGIRESRPDNLDSIIGNLVSIGIRAEPQPDALLLVIRGLVSPAKIDRIRMVAERLPMPVKVVEWHDELGPEQIEEDLGDLLKQLTDTS